MDRAAEFSIKMVAGEYYRRRDNICGIASAYASDDIYCFAVGGITVTWDGLQYQGDQDEDNGGDVVEHIPVSGPQHPNHVPASSPTPVAAELPVLVAGVNTHVELTPEQVTALLALLTPSANVNEHKNSCLSFLRDQLKTSDPRSMVAKWFEDKGCCMNPNSSVMDYIMGDVSGLRALLASISIS